MDHSPGFLKVVNEARPHVKEITVDQARERLTRNPKAVLMDVTERAWRLVAPAKLVKQHDARQTSTDKPKRS